MRDLEAVKVSSTVIVISKDMKALIVQRPSDKTFANLWTVAGGKIRDDEFIHPRHHVYVNEGEREIWVRIIEVFSKYELSIPKKWWDYDPW